MNWKMARYVSGGRHLIGGLVVSDGGIGENGDSIFEEGFHEALR